MKLSLLIFAVALSTACGLYMYPKHRPRDEEVFQSLASFFNQLGRRANMKRCANTFDESCLNGPIGGATSDENWLSNGSPGKRCSNIFGSSCVDGGTAGAGADEDFLGGGGGPGRR
ncbi:unnamed protein product [Tenebrio molitor]|nr:unnamed protein product [Tenebrio molitor]